MTHQPRKRFGQNFLKDPQVIARLVELIAPQASECLVEIGPGLGALTRALLPQVTQLHAVELDRDLVATLEQWEAPKLILHQADALRFDFTSLCDAEKKLRIVGNLPYNISTPLIFHLLENASLIHDMYFMLQKEVVSRLAAPVGTKAYGRLSVMTQYFCDVTPYFEVPPAAFSPAPKVQSQIVRLVPYQELPYVVNDFDGFEAVVRAAFGQRRKTLRNALKTLVSAERLDHLDFDLGVRAEAVSVGEYVRLVNLLYN